MILVRICLLCLFIPVTVRANVKAYFNHNPSSSYSDPYRNIFRQGDNLEQLLLEQISKAKKSIFVAVQELRLPLVAKALIEKFQSGVDVRVVLEHDYNFTVMTQREGQEDEYEATKLNELKALVDMDHDGKISKFELETRDAIYMLQKANVPVMDDTSDNSRGSGLMHHKFMIVDGKSVIISTANFTLSCIHGDILSTSSRGNANSMVLVQSTAMAQIFEEEFSQLWGNGKRGNFGHNKTYRGPQTVTVRGKKITVQFSPTSARYDWEESVNGLISLHLNKAKKSIKSALFVYSDQKISDILEQRYKSGVQVGFLVESKFAFREYSELLDMAGLALFGANCAYEPDNRPWKKPNREIGVPFLNRGDVLHHKFGVVDDSTVIVGSQNWSHAANYVNDETLIVIEDSSTADSYTKEYDRLLPNSRMGVPSSVRRDISRAENNCAGPSFSY